MKRLLLILFAGCVHSAHAQAVYVSMVDSAVRTLEKRQIIYYTDSLHSEFGRDSNMVRTDSLRFLYADSRGKNLLMVNEWSWASGDTSGIVYYFRDKKLVKVYATVHSRNMTTEQSFYFKNNKLMFPTHYRNLFDIDDYIERSKKYLKFKGKKPYPNFADHIRT